MTWIVLAHTAAAWFGAGFIWTMQVLNYPLLALVGADGFVAYERAHNRRFARVVAPAVVIVTAATVTLFFVRPAELPLAAVVVQAGLIVVIIALTALLQAPAHARLARGFDAGVHARLVRTNWARTAAWTLLGLVDLWVLAATA